MRVYVESNFILELVLEQAEERACESILSLAEEGRIELAIPAIALLEAQLTLESQRARRTKLNRLFQDEMHEIDRTRSLKDSVAWGAVAELLARSAKDAADRYRRVASRLFGVAQLIPFDAAGARASTEVPYALSRFDSIVLASVLRDLDSRPAPSCFPNRDKDFSNPTIVAELARRECKALGGFTQGLGYLGSRSPS